MRRASVYLLHGTRYIHDTININTKQRIHLTKMFFNHS